MRFKLLVGILLSVAFAGPGLAADDAAPLTLKGYLAQVRADGPDYQRAISDRKVIDLNRLLLGKHWTAQAAITASRDGAMGLYDPSGTPQTYWFEHNNFYGTASYSDQLSLGIDPGISYSWDRRTQLANGASGDSIPTWGDDYTVGFTVPLWQNFLGAQVRAQDRRDELANDASATSGDFAVPAAIFAAEQAYEALAYDRANLAQDEALAAAYQRLQAWAKARNNALDRVQADTAVEGLLQSMERLQDQERLDRGLVNRLRGVTGTEVGPLQSLDELAEAGGDWPSAAPARLDLQALNLSLASEAYQVRFSREGVKLPVNLSLGMVGNLSGGIPSVGNGSFEYDSYTAQPDIHNYNVNVSVTVPFEYFLARWTAPLKVVEQQAQQQQRDLDEAVNADAQQWDDMTLRFQRSAQRLADAARFESDSKHKAGLGEAALAKGRLGMFEALSFQSAWSSAVLNRLQWVQQRLTLLAQARLYQARRDGWKDEVR